MISFTKEKKNQFQREADAFLASLPAGLQRIQSEAVRKAVDGCPSDLQRVRQTRNNDVALPGHVIAEYVRPDMRLYRPAAEAGEQRPLLIYLHGGGWTFGSINSCARFCGALAGHGLSVLAVNYRLAPEHPYPAALGDCQEAIELAMAKASLWGCSPDRISVGGDSSGGNLAVVSCLKRNEEGSSSLCSLLLFYPVVKAWEDNSPSWRKYAEGYGLDAALMNAFNRAYIPEGKQCRFISPALASNEELSALPPTLFIAAERDILYDQGREFAGRLLSSGVAVRYVAIPLSIHLFVTVQGQEAAFEQAVRLSAAFLKRSQEEAICAARRHHVLKSSGDR